MTGVLLLVLFSTPAIDWNMAPTPTVSESTATAMWVRGPCPGGYCVRPVSVDVPASPAPPPPADVYGDEYAPPIPGTSSEVNVKVYADVQPRGDACDQASNGVYVAASSGAVIVQQGEVRRFARGPVRGFFRRVAGRIVERVQARRSARQARWAARRGGVAMAAYSEGDACSSARW
ncbi:MAG: hypothetical protein V2A79_10745 [Planctomycetota bacterium]